MSTRSRLGYKDKESGRYITVYRHCDGYLEGAGLDMWNGYKNYEDVSGKLLDDYGNDYVEEFDTLDDLKSHFNNSDLEYVYIFEDGIWKCADRYGWKNGEINDFRPLTEMFDSENVAYSGRETKEGEDEMELKHSPLDPSSYQFEVASIVASVECLKAHYEDTDNAEIKSLLGIIGGAVDSLGEIVKD